MVALCPWTALRYQSQFLVGVGILHLHLHLLFFHYYMTYDMLHLTIYDLYVDAEKERSHMVVMALGMYMSKIDDAAYSSLWFHSLESIY